MRIVALEEHGTFPDLAARIRPRPSGRGVLSLGGHLPPAVARGEQLQDVGAGRIDDMDAAGITPHVPSVAQAGADLVPGEEGTALVRSYRLLRPDGAGARGS